MLNDTATRENDLPGALVYNHSSVIFGLFIKIGS